MAAMVARLRRSFWGSIPVLSGALWSGLASAQAPSGASFPAEATPAPAPPPAGSAPATSAPGPAAPPPPAAAAPAVQPAPAQAAPAPPAPSYPATAAPQEPSYAPAYAEPPPPPAPPADQKGGIPPISLRIDPLNWILIGRLGLELEVGLIKWISVETVPVFVTTESPPWLSYGSSIDVTQHSTGWGPLAGASLGLNFWLSGKSMQGYSIGTGFRSYGLEYKTDVDSASHTARQLYALFGSVSRWGAFTVAGGIGLAYDLNNESRCYSENAFGVAQVGPGDCDEIQLATGFPLRTNPIVVVSPFAYPWEILVRFSLGVTID